MKISLISATSIFALLSASVGHVHAAALSTAPTQLNIYDLVHDGATSSDGGDGTVSRQDPLISAAQALKAGSGHWRTAGFTGPVDQGAVAQGYPTIPLGVAPGTKTDNDLASSIVSTGHWDATEKARAIGQYRVAALVGTVGKGSAVEDKSGSTVFVAAASPVGFNDTGNESGGVRGTAVAFAFTPSSTSTATITVAGAGNLSRQGFDGGFTVAAANSLRAAPAVVRDATPAVAMSDAAQPTLGYNYAPARELATKANAVAASFSDVVTANGVVALVTTPATPAKVQTSQLQPGRAQSGRFQTSDVAADMVKLIDMSETTQGPHKGTQIDGTRAFISASVSANPTATAALYMANVVNATRTAPAGQSVEAFQIGPSGPKAQASLGKTVSDPLHGKVMASAGALNNSLALP